MKKSYTSAEENSCRLLIRALYKTLFLMAFSPKGEILMDSYTFTSNVLKKMSIISFNFFNPKLGDLSIMEHTFNQILNTL